jgi:hypothetical protein
MLELALSPTFLGLDESKKADNPTLDLPPQVVFQHRMKNNKATEPKAQVANLMRHYEYEQNLRLTTRIIRLKRTRQPT